MSPTVLSFRDLIVWQRAMQAAGAVHRLALTFPKEERFILTAQVRRAVISVASNIAEGHTRQGREFAYFLSVARSSSAEVETQLLLAVEFGYATTEQIDPIIGLLVEVRRMAAAITNRIADH